MLNILKSIDKINIIYRQFKNSYFSIIFFILKMRFMNILNNYLIKNSINCSIKGYISNNIKKRE